MIQLDLYRSISLATGDSVATIKRLGFLIADPSQPISDPEAECFSPHVLDWDELDDAEPRKNRLDATPSQPKTRRWIR